ncbi:Polysaccharide biosynthesis/export protein [Planctomycetes bacterium Poly30]|uniref:Polysaccharide biosynthesis/export protein n=1 Tax=Saltatorellus ferox TaxID=2528018 RepID=A0A518EM85_9BACT|nr:Polysaccharide biosynthesis/export protein [Planctomycetes bacterium Poly30]
MRPTLYEELWPGDTFDVKFRRTPELDSTVTVGPDGFVQLPLAGRIRASGRTPADLEVDIERLCQAEIKDPEASVLMTGFEGRAVHVGGEVKDPGRFVLTGPTTPLEALIQAGGTLESAALDNVLLVRAFENGGRRVFALDLKATIAGRDQTGHLRLVPSDLLLVPRSGIANVNVWVDQYIRKNLPFNILIRPDAGVF